MPGRIALAALAFALLLGGGPAVAQDKIKVIATFSILADLTKNVGGARAEVPASSGRTATPMSIRRRRPTPRGSRNPKLVFANGLGFEGWITRLIKASGTKALHIVASKGVKPRKAGGGHDHGHAAGDPHAWQSVANVKIYVGNIRDALIAADPAGKTTYEANAAGYLGKLDALEREISDAVARIPAERRRIITTHDAFGYFRDAYGLDFIAPQGVSTESEVSARDVARIIAQIKKQKIPAVFMENVSDPRLLKRIADETGAKIGGTLYSDALTEEKGHAPTYIDLVRHNVRTLAAALMS